MGAGRAVDDCFPRCLIAGIQVGLGLKLCMKGAKYVRSELALGAPLLVLVRRWAGVIMGPMHGI